MATRPLRTLPWLCLCPSSPSVQTPRLPHNPNPTEGWGAHLQTCPLWAYPAAPLRVTRSGPGSTAARPADWPSWPLKTLAPAGSCFSCFWQTGDSRKGQAFSTSWGPSWDRLHPPDVHLCVTSVVDSCQPLPVESWLPFVLVSERWDPCHFLNCHPHGFSCNKHLLQCSFNRRSLFLYNFLFRTNFRPTEKLQNW